MDLQVDTASLQRALACALVAREHMALTGPSDEVRLEASAATLSISVSDGLRALTLRVPCHIARSGEGHYSLRQLASIAAGLPSEPARLVAATAEQRLTIRSRGLSIALGGGRATLGMKRPSTAQLAPILRCSAEALRQAILQVRYAAGTDSRRSILMGALVQIRGAQARLTAADGFRLATVALGLHEAAAEAHDLVIGRQDLAIIESLLEGESGDASLLLSPSHENLLLQTAGAEYECRTVPGNYPDTSRFAPQAPAAAVDIQTQPLREASQLVERLGLLVGGRISLAIESGGPATLGRVTLRATSTEGDSIEGACEGQAEGQSITYWLSNSYLREALAAIGAEQIRLEVRAPDQLLYLRPMGVTTSWHLIMPMRPPEQG